MSIQSVSASPWAFGATGRCTAMEKELTGMPLGVYLSSGSLPIRPIKTTRFSIYVLLVRASTLVCLCRLGCCYCFFVRFVHRRFCGRGFGGLLGCGWGLLGRRGRGGGGLLRRCGGPRGGGGALQVRGRRRVPFP